MTKGSKNYEAPRTEVIFVEAPSVFCVSGTFHSTGHGSNEAMIIEEISI